MMYESIPNELRNMEAGSKRMEPYKRGLLHRAARAIEELSMKLHGDEAAIAGMKREIEQMVRAGKTRWIPVTERLPDEKQAEDVLCWIMDGDPKDEGYCVSGCYKTLTKSWCLDADWADPWKITHWMPAPQGPEPPKEET